MDALMIIILGIWAVIATILCIIYYWDLKDIKNKYGNIKQESKT